MAIQNSDKREKLKKKRTNINKPNLTISCSALFGYHNIYNQIQFFLCDTAREFKMTGASVPKASSFLAMLYG